MLMILFILRMWLFHQVTWKKLNDSSGRHLLFIAKLRCFKNSVKRIKGIANNTKRTIEVLENLMRRVSMNFKQQKVLLRKLTDQKFGLNHTGRKISRYLSMLWMLLQPKSS